MQSQIWDELSSTSGIYKVLGIQYRIIVVPKSGRQSI